MGVNQTQTGEQTVAIFFLFWVFCVIVAVIAVIDASEPCTAEGQCIENAECSSSTGGLCECNAGYYHEATHCVPVKPPSKGCTASLQV